MPNSSHSDKILIVDDEATNIQLLTHLLAKKGYQNTRSTQDSRETLPLYLEFQPDLILLDLMMPFINGWQLLTMLRQLIPATNFVPILVLTADVTKATRERALSCGANDFLTKPFDITEITLRIHNLLQTRQLYLQLEQHRHMLQKRVFEQTQELEESRIQILARLALAAEYRDDNTGHHTQRVGRIAALLATSLGLPEAEILLLRRAAPLHDVGKIGIPDHILLKPGRLTTAEFEIMRTHTTIGAHILKDNHVPLLHLAETIALTHHERWDGTGYPHGIAGEAIPLVGRIVAVSDAYDTLTHERPYKHAWSSQEAIAEIEKQNGTQFDPDVVKVFLQLANANHFRETKDRPEGVILNNARLSGVQAPVTSNLSPLPEHLTPREYEVLQLLSQGQTNREIAQALIVSVGTVKVHVEHILGKLGVNDRTHAAVRAFELGLLRLKTDCF
ncbi:MAG: response regulator [Herpetosiphonaceae bacterium]|nr:response regulator [Herpetosiphonaceae bacterium]